RGEPDARTIGFMAVTRKKIARGRFGCALDRAVYTAGACRSTGDRHLSGRPARRRRPRQCGRAGQRHREAGLRQPAVLSPRRPRLVRDSINPVGYHAWADGHTLVLFVLGSPSTLQIADASSRGARGEVVARDIGRSLQRIPGRPSVSFVQRDSVGGPWLEEL